ncbi:DNA polymerase III PolC-type [Pseudomonas phage tabernarius]|uniref:DNA polymerase III PolC-type n=1 Tax=Pseudomonas phage tabernarius TaxID=2048978 RepID=A0A2H4P6W5_9CAUD|nr:DNA polymerase III PolC-type [Pseudomonas phage tabernarius]ATW57917.1 DNA polymerase III PolC-type [Pseudomonas phage tabernarius]
MMFALFDFETTGLPLHRRASVNKQPKAIEFGGILTDGVRIIEELNVLINPNMPLESVITRITGITDEMLEGEPTFPAHVESIGDFFGKADAVMSHNLSFDKFIAECEMSRIDEHLGRINWPALEICSVEETRHLYGFNMKLEKLYEIYVGPLVQTHRASDDCKMLFEVAKATGIFRAWGAK